MRKKMDDVKQVTIQFQDQTLGDDQRASQLKRSSDSDSLTTAGDVRKPDVNVWHVASSSSSSSNNSSNSSPALMSLDPTINDRETEANGSTPADTGDEVGGSSLTEVAHCSGEDCEFLEPSDVISDNAGHLLRQPVPVHPTPIKLPLQSISDRMNWSIGNHLLTPATDGTMAAVHFPWSTLRPAAWLMLNSTSVIQRQSLPLPTLSSSASGSDLSQTDDSDFDVELDDDVIGESDENVAIPLTTGRRSATTWTSIGTYWYRASSPAKCRCHGIHSATTPMPGCCCSLSDDDHEVRDAFIRPPVDASVMTSVAGRCHEQTRRSVAIVPSSCATAAAPSWKACRRAASVAGGRMSSSRVTLNCLPRPSLDFNKMQKTCIARMRTGKVRRRYKQRLQRRHAGAIRKLQRHLSNDRRQQRLSSSQDASSDSTASATVEFDDVTVTQTPDAAAALSSSTGSVRRAYYHQQRQQLQGPPGHASVGGDLLDPAVFRFRSIWFAAGARYSSPAVD